MRRFHACALTVNLHMVAGVQSDRPPLSAACPCGRHKCKLRAQAAEPDQCGDSTPVPLRAVKVRAWAYNQIVLQPWPPAPAAGTSVSSGHRRPNQISAAIARLCPYGEPLYGCPHWFISRRREQAAKARQRGNSTPVTLRGTGVVCQPGIRSNIKKNRSQYSQE
jgi:hypothetical protein